MPASEAEAGVGLSYRPAEVTTADIWRGSKLLMLLLVTAGVAEWQNTRKCMETVCTRRFLFPFPIWPPPSCLVFDLYVFIPFGLFPFLSSPYILLTSTLGNPEHYKTQRRLSFCSFNLLHFLILQLTIPLVVYLISALFKNLAFQGASESKVKLTSTSIKCDKEVVQLANLSNSPREIALLELEANNMRLDDRK
jgi:hypothetical protein